MTIPCEQGVLSSEDRYSYHRGRRETLSQVENIFYRVEICGKSSLKRVSVQEEFYGMLNLVAYPKRSVHRMPYYKTKPTHETLANHGQHDTFTTAVKISDWFWLVGISPTQLLIATIATTNGAH